MIQIRVHIHTSSAKKPRRYLVARSAAPKASMLRDQSDPCRSSSDVFCALRQSGYTLASSVRPAAVARISVRGESAAVESRNSRRLTRGRTFLSRVVRSIPKA